MNDIVNRNSEIQTIHCSTQRISFLMMLVIPLKKRDTPVSWSARNTRRLCAGMNVKNAMANSDYLRQRIDW